MNLVVLVQASCSLALRTDVDPGRRVHIRAFVKPHDETGSGSHQERFPDPLLYMRPRARRK